MAMTLSFSDYSSLAIFLLLPPLISLLLLLKQIRSGKRTRLNFPPGPTPIPILGHLHRIDRGTPHRSLFHLSKTHGPVMKLRFGLRPTVVISSARMAGELFKCHDAMFSRRPALVSNRTLTYNFLDVAFSPENGEYWKNMRKLLVSNLLNTKTVQLFRPIREAEVWRMISSVGSSCTTSPPHHDPPRPINLKEVLETLVTNVVLVSAFGMGLNGREEEGGELHRIGQQMVDTLNRFFIEDFVPWLRWMDVVGGFYYKLQKAFEDMDAFYERVIEAHLDPMRPKQESEDCVDVLLRIQKESNLTRDHVKAMLMNILIGATDSTTSVIAWGMAELVRNRGALKKCQEEVRKIVGKKGKVEEEDLPQLEYLKAAVKEAMRLHPPGPLLIPRMCTQQCQIGGYDILPGSFLIINAWAIGRDPEAWDGPHDRNQFFPERFMNSSIDYKGQDFGLLPFGSGRRGCPGIHFAPPTIELALANLLYSFDWELPADDEKMSKETTVDIAEATGLVNFPESNLYVPTKHDFN